MLRFLLILIVISGFAIANQCLKFYGNFQSHSINEAFFMYDNSEIGKARIQFVRQETEEIFASYFVYDGIRIGRAGLAELRNAARRGVKTRLIVDGWGVEWWDGGIDLATLAALKESGVQIRFFNPVKNHPFLKWFDSKFWIRSHDKLLYLGSQKMFFMGDLNMQNVNFRTSKEPNQIGKSYISTETAYRSDVALDVKSHLEDIWQVSKEYSTTQITPEQIRKAHRNLNRMMDFNDKLVEKVTSKEDWNHRLQPVEGISFISEKMDEKGKLFRLKSEQISAMATANNRIIIFSPYSLMDEEYLQVINKALSKGVNVTLFVPLGEKTNNPLSTFALVPLAKRLISMGVDVREVEIKDKTLGNSMDMLHAKGMVIDDFYVNSTSHNFNDRSNITDIESAVIIKDSNYVKTQIEPFLDLLSKNSREYKAPAGFQAYYKVWIIQWLRKIKVFGKQL